MTVTPAPRLANKGVSEFFKSPSVHRQRDRTGLVTPVNLDAQLGMMILVVPIMDAYSGQSVSLEKATT